MIEPRKPVATVAVVDKYCQSYRNLFLDVRNSETFKFLHLGMISEVKRKSLPAIARTAGLSNRQKLHHFLRDTPPAQYVGNLGRTANGIVSVNFG